MIIYLSLFIKVEFLNYNKDFRMIDLIVHYD